MDLKALHAKIGELTPVNDFLPGALSQAGLLSAKRPRARAAFDAAGEGAEAQPEHDLLEARPVSAEDLALMRRIDELHLDYPFAGARMLKSAVGPREPDGRSPSPRDADEANGDRGDLSAAE